MPSNSGNLRIEVSTPPNNRYYGNNQSPEMSENVPFLGSGSRSPYASPIPSRTSFSSPLGSPSLRGSQSNAASSPYGNPHHRSDYSPPASPMLAGMSIPTTGARRSRARLVLLSLLAILGFAAIIASMNAAPEHVKSQALDYVTKAGGTVKESWESLHADEIWAGAKEWSGWSGRPAGSDLEQEDDETVVNEQSQIPQQEDQQEQIEDLVAPIPTTSTAVTEEPTPVVEEPIEATQTLNEETVPETTAAPGKELLEAVTDEALATSTEEIIPSAPAFAIPTREALLPAKPITATGTLEKVVHPIYVLPDPPRLPQGGPDEQFFSYLPHSGFHNQRIELANAMTLATMLNRTLLLPPVWIGWPATTQPYRLMQQSWDLEMKDHRDAFLPRNASSLVKRQRKPKVPVVVPSEEECKSYAKECRATYQDTFVAWSFLVDMGLVETRLPVVDRFNMSESYAMEMTGATGPDDVYLLQDTAKYYYRFDDTADGGEMIEKLDPVKSKYLFRVSVPLLREHTVNHKLIMMGSIFGSGRLVNKQPANQRNLAFFHRALAFRNPLLETPANIIRDLMGGPRGYAGIHARVGDGAFKITAVENMDVTFTQLMEKLEVNKNLIPAMLEKGKARYEKLVEEQAKEAAAKAAQEGKAVTKRQLQLQSDPDSAWTMLDDFANDGRHTMALPQKDHNALAKRQRLATLGPIEDREDSPLSPTLKCRGELYTDPKLLALNNPVYLATDSPHPLSDPVLSNFWANLPCTFILADFDRVGPQNTGDPVDSLRFMEGAINQNDGVKLGRLLLPFMEAAVAAKATVTVGTRGSTFSGFAAGFLHDAYADDVAFASGDGKRS